MAWLSSMISSRFPTDMGVPRRSSTLERSSCRGSYVTTGLRVKDAHKRGQMNPMSLAFSFGLLPSHTGLNWYQAFFHVLGKLNLCRKAVPCFAEGFAEISCSESWQCPTSFVERDRHCLSDVSLPCYKMWFHKPRRVQTSCFSSWGLSLSWFLMNSSSISR